VRRLLGCVLALSVSTAACAALSGLDRFAAGVDDASVVAVQPDPETGADDVQAPADTQGGDEPGPDTGQPDGTTVSEGDGGADVHAASDAATRDASGSDSGSPRDASMAPDAYVCGTTSCGGCCSSGVCVGGQSVATCGVGGVLCKDCTSMGACSGGACATPPPDAGPPPMCVQSQCTNTCAVFFIQGVCCKSDQTCGCQYTAFGPCN
jgi:hypothetical protein